MKILLIILLLVSSVAAQSKWDYQGTQGKEKIYFERSSVKRDGSIIKLWIKFQGRKTATSFTGFDCAENTVRQYVASKDSKLTGDWNMFHPISPNTRGEWLFNKACAYPY